MKFECGDLDKALANPDLMAEAHQHLRDCAMCRNEYRIWNEIAGTAKQLHCEWESPDLWPNIQRALKAQPGLAKRRRPAWRLSPGWWLRMDWKLRTIAATAAAIIVLAFVRWPQAAPLRPADNKVDSATLSSRDFLTEQALRDLEKNETAYRHSIEALSRLAEPKLSGPTSSPILLSYREKLLMLDSAILETRSNVTQNRFNMRLQTELADLYLEKRQTLQEILTDGQRN